MSLYRRGKQGTWWTDSVVNGRRIHKSLRTRDRRTAERLQGALRDREVVGAAGLEPGADPVQIRRPLLDHARDWRLWLVARGRSPLYADKGYGAVEDAAAELDLTHAHDCEPGDAARWIGALHGRVSKGEISAKTANNLRDYLVTFWRWMAKHGRSAKGNPWIGTPRLRWDKPMQERALGAYECRQLLAAPPPAPPGSVEGWRRRRTLYAFLMMTGIRMGAARGLTAADFRLDGLRPWVRVPAALNKSRREQVVPLAAPVAELLREAVAGLEPTARLWPRGAHPRTFARDLVRAGVETRDEHGRGLSPHALRRSLGTRLAAAGVPVGVARAVLGHSDARTTERFYQDQVNLPQREAVEAVADVLEPLRATGTDGVGDSVAPACHRMAPPGTNFGGKDPKFGPQRVGTAGEKSAAERSRTRSPRPQRPRGPGFLRAHQNGVGTFVAPDEAVARIDAAIRKIIGLIGS